MAISLKLSVNSAPVTVSVEPYILLVQLLCEHPRLTGTHVGYDTAQCDACTVHMNGWVTKSCSILAVQADGAEVTTIEGLSKDGVLYLMQEAFRQCHGLQYGLCAPDMVMMATVLVVQHPHPDGHTMREQLDGNLCRCTGCHNIARAVMHGAEAMVEAQGDDTLLQGLVAAWVHAAWPRRGDHHECFRRTQQPSGWCVRQT